MTKANRRTLAIKKAKRKKIIVISVGAVFAALILAFAVYSITRPEIPSRVYATGPQSVTLYEDGRFSFVDCRFVRTGTFTEIESNDAVTIIGNNDDVTIAFFHNNRTVHGSISNDILTIPMEWDSGKGHSPHLRLQ